jgi:hypothetical protein
MRRPVVALLVGCQLLTSGCAAVVAAAGTHAALVATAIELAPIALIAGGVTAVGIMGAAKNEPETYEAGTLGGFLQASQAESERLVDIGVRNQHEALVLAGLQVQRAVGRARLAYGPSLGRKDTALGEPERLFERQVGEILAALGSGRIDTIKEAGDRAQSIALRLRLPEDSPLVASTGPVYLFSFLPFQTVSVRGRFPAAYPNGAVPRLVVRGKSYNAYSYSTESIDFSLATNMLLADDPHAIAWSKAELVVPWDKPLFGPLSRGHSEIVLIGVLPDSLGRATVTTTIAGASGEPRVVTESFDLKWGERRTYATAPGDWTLRYSVFNRAAVEVDKTDLGSPFVRIASDARGMTLRTYPF